jgi:hypothetical protein
MNRALFLILPLSVLGCEVSNQGPAGNCTDHGQCGEMQACIEFTCTDVECIGSSDCPLHNFCDQENDRFECLAGCQSDEDCVAGESCDPDSHTCEEYGCRSTELDCPVGHTCNQATGDCVASQGLCTQTCDVYDRPNCGGGYSCEVGGWGDECIGDRDCDQGASCDMFLASHDQCYDNSECPDGSECYGAIPGWLPGQCVISYCHSDYCMPNCNANNPDCPAGFSCEDLGTYAVCYGACDWYVDNGYL